MADPRQPRECAPSPQDDLLGDAACNDSPLQGLDPRLAADGTPRDRS